MLFLAPPSSRERPHGSSTALRPVAGRGFFVGVREARSAEDDVLTVARANHEAPFTQRNPRPRGPVESERDARQVPGSTSLGGRAFFDEMTPGHLVIRVVSLLFE
jgi:hypothetical protein